jgi:hypothetical protein
MQYGCITLIDISDKKNPFILSKVIYGNEITYSACIGKNEDFIFI